MATILLSAAGAAIGGAVGGTVAGLSSVAIGRAVGATLGRAIDERLLGAGSDPVETGKVSQFRLTQASEGQPIAQVLGRTRIGGQVIWASDFQESTTTTGGGKGGPRQPSVTRYSYSVSLAIALCEGEIASVPRVWADGEEVSPLDLNMTVYRGTPDQAPDPVMEAIEGAGKVPAYRGTAYVVLEDIALDGFGNRVPQFSFEVIRGAQPGGAEFDLDPAQLVRGVALMPGTGEYALASRAVNYSGGPGDMRAANTHSPSGQTDLLTSLAALEEELPTCKATSLIVSWFGDDLRCGECRIKPKVEQKLAEGVGMPWQVSGQDRSSAEEVPKDEDDNPLYGGTPADAAVVEAIKALNAAGQRVMFYPFILMDQAEGNGLPDPWSDNPDQPHLPWRGRITLSVAPGRAGSPDQSAAADAEVAAFMGQASAGDFTIGDGTVTYSGPEDWGLRRFILHNAALCAAAGGVAAFCISSEMRGLTQIRGVSGFPAVTALRALAAEVRQILGPEVKIGYAADWSEYWGYQSPEGDRYFHLDPLWADAEVDFIGIDNYMPLSDWRQGTDHLDAEAGVPAIYDLDYLRGNIEGGEGYDWYYHSPEAEAAQIRTPITDGAHQEPWIWRYKDLRNWWGNTHHERIGGVRQPLPTAWEPQSKPIWFTELGCAAIDRGTNQPNKFLDPKSSESRLPKYSNGQRDDLIQLQYLRAMLGYWSDPANNPISPEYDAPMLDMDNAYVWAWDARPFPAFPAASEVWSDGENYLRGHWLNGRIGQRTLSSAVTEICTRSGVSETDVSSLYGIVHGYSLEGTETARAALQPLMLRHGFDVIEQDGLLRFLPRKGTGARPLEPQQLVDSPEVEGDIAHQRAAEAELTGRVRLRYAEWGANYDLAAQEAVLPDQATHAAGQHDLPMVLTGAEARQIAERWLIEARIARDSARFVLPPSRLDIAVGDVIALPIADPGAEEETSGQGSESAEETPTLYRVDRIEMAEAQLVEAVRIDPGVYLPSPSAEELPGVNEFAAPVPVLPLFMDLPLLTGEETPHAPHLAITAQPWPGSVAVYGAQADEGYTLELEEVIAARSVIGITQSPLLRGPVGRWDLGADLQVKLIFGQLQSRDMLAVLNGANAAAIGDGSNGNWEIFQFRSAELLAPETYLLRGRLRGQLGSDGLMPDIWPEGSFVVLLDDTLRQLDLPLAQRRRARHYRIGPARRGYDDPSYVHRIEAFDGNGLRPYAPVHLRLEGALGGAIQVSWIRRTRIEGDSWDLQEVPLGEAREEYLLRVLRGPVVLREVTLSAPGWSYSAVMQVADGALPGDRIEVAQVSDRFGAGPAARAVLT
ncbi:phage host specificity protein [Phaeobacter gallaeciensis]|uniref:Phage host specificity protein n=1 Tax=Phaeobacter gallaeciensis TaxID=60890 RepID=A0A1B0ZM44_9RHOB|nr:MULTISPECIES: glycoside hydrolase TIM-barrel-like domain-containing protein [Phaeobacter]ANP35252.1 phage host specificity protein [Phaeobacter gallaeciensis]PVZ51278.1 host specificity protein [Phaeobacter sp. JL2872]